jgi:hypothetical protein
MLELLKLFDRPLIEGVHFLGRLLGEHSGYDADVDVGALGPAALNGISPASLKVCA